MKPLFTLKNFFNDTYDGFLIIIGLSQNGERGLSGLNDISRNGIFPSLYIASYGSFENSTHMSKQILWL